MRINASERCNCGVYGPDSWFQPPLVNPLLPQIVHPQIYKIHTPEATTRRVALELAIKAQMGGEAAALVETAKAFEAYLTGEAPKADG